MKNKTSKTTKSRPLGKHGVGRRLSVKRVLNKLKYERQMAKDQIAFDVKHKTGMKKRIKNNNIYILEVEEAIRLLS